MALQPRVLVVEDDPDLLTLLEILLSDAGFAVDVAANGREALDVIGRASPDLILLDMAMPVMSGSDFAHELHLRNPAPPPIVVMTAAPDARQRAAEIGARDVLGKPFELAALLKTVRSHTARGPPA